MTSAWQNAWPWRRRGLEPPDVILVPYGWRAHDLGETSRLRLAEYEAYLVREHALCNEAECLAWLEVE